METRGKGEPEFHYDRARRLAKAGPDAMFAIAMHDGKRPSFFRSLVATRSLRFMLLAVVLALVAVVVYQLNSGLRSGGTLGAARYELQAVWFEGDAYLTVSRRAREPGATLPAAELRLGIGPAGADARMEAGETELRIRLPAPVKPAKAAAVISATGSSLELTTAIR